MLLLSFVFFFLSSVIFTLMNHLVFQMYTTYEDVSFVEQIWVSATGWVRSNWKFFYYEKKKRERERILQCIRCLNKEFTGPSCSWVNNKYIEFYLKNVQYRTSTYYLFIQVTQLFSFPWLSQIMFIYWVQV